MFSDYKVQVVDFYKRKREQGHLPLHLINPTPAKLKKECLLVFQSRRTKTDMAILRQFFGHREEESGYLNAIKTIDTDRFKPLVNFLKEQTQHTDDKNIELLSWLLDFSPRPYKYGAQMNGMTIDEFKEETSTMVSVLDQNDIITLERESVGSSQSDLYLEPLTIGAESNLHQTPWYQKKRIIVFGLTIVVFTFLLSFNKYLKSNSFFGIGANENQCMYWATDHYMSLPCDHKVPNVNIIALDLSNLNHFKKITRPDTLTLSDINKVWYSKVEKVVEFYTAPGNHPEHPEKQLKPLSKYMFIKYVEKGKNKVK